MLRALSLFSNIGIAEARLDEINVDVILANEIDKRRSAIYKHIYPNTEMIIGDITNADVRDTVVKKAIEEKVDLLLATPPCQGMSTAGKKDPLDERNQLIWYAIDVIIQTKPKYIIIENVPQQLKTKIRHNDDMMLIPEYIKNTLKEYYNIEDKVVDMSLYGVPQIRKRSIFIMTRKDIKVSWSFPAKEDKVKTLKDVISHLPELDPKIQGFSESELLKIFPHYYTKKDKGIRVSKWHYPPMHKWRHVRIMRHTPTDKSAFENEKYYPQKDDGTRIKGHKNTYKRQAWDKPGYTVTTYNAAICSYDNVHPGRKNKDGTYSDARALSIYELMLVMTIPPTWNLPENCNESVLRHAIGEGIPPLMMNKLLEPLLNELELSK